MTDTELAPDVTDGSRADLTAVVYAQIRDRILDHTLSPGQSITISTLARSLGCSHTPVREALAMLASGEIVERVHNRGYRVTELPTQREVAELYDFRFLVEPWAAARAAARVSPTQLRLLRRETDRFARAIGESETPARELAKHDDAFHRLIFEIADNRQVAASYDRCQVHLCLFRLASSARDHPKTLAEHRAIVAALEQADPARAREAMTEHIGNSHERMLPRADP